MLPLDIPQQAPEFFMHFFPKFFLPLISFHYPEHGGHWGQPGGAPYSLLRPAGYEGQGAQATQDKRES